MDLSDKYVNMCLAATEMQESWNPKAMDCYCGKFAWSSIRDFDYVYSMDDNSPRPSNGTCIKRDGLLKWHDDLIRFDCWIPRLDQLMEMAQIPFVYLIRDIDSEIRRGVNWLEKVDLNSPEQIILARIMAVRYYKMWNEQEWVEIKTIKHKNKMPKRPLYQKRNVLRTK